MAKYADIIVDISHEKLDRTFQYRIPETMEDEIAAGSAVIVPFGRGSREIKDGNRPHLRGRCARDPVVRRGLH